MVGWTTERETAIAAAQQAGRILLEMAGKVSVQFKGRNDLVTEADRAAQEAIRQALARRYPAFAFLGEEGAATRPTREPGARRWIVDPLDGTTNFVHGLPFFSVAIALEVDGRIVVGVVHDPVRNECFSAAAGAGGYCNHAAIQVSATATLGDALVGVGMPADVASVPDSLAAFATLSHRVRSMRRLGSAALTLAYVAAGRLDGFWAHDLKPWDAAAGCVLIAEAGGRVTNLDESPYNLYTPDIVATNGLIHSDLARIAHQPRDAGG